MNASAHFRFAALSVATLALAAAVIATPARAGVIDPQIFIQQSGSSPANGPNLITNTGSFVVGVAGSFTLQNPLLVIVGVLNGNGTPTISFSGCADPSACAAPSSLPIYGLTQTTATFTASSTGSAFSQLGITQAGSSENWSNWSSFDSDNGFGTATSYSLYAFALPTSLMSGSPISIDESGAANGSFIIAWDCQAGDGSSTGCTSKGTVGQTIMTNTGVVDGNVPEPGTLALFAAGLIGCALVIGRRRRARQS